MLESETMSSRVAAESNITGLKALMLKEKLTLRDVAAAIEISYGKEVPLISISRWARGVCRPRAIEAVQVAKALGSTPHELFDRRFDGGVAG